MSFLAYTVSSPYRALKGHQGNYENVNPQDDVIKTRVAAGEICWLRKR